MATDTTVWYSDCNNKKRIVLEFGKSAFAVSVDLTIKEAKSLVKDIQDAIKESK